MKQIAVVKITMHNGQEHRRNMHLAEDVWKDIVRHNPNGDTKWELRAVEPVDMKTVKIGGTDLNEIKRTKSKVDADAKAQAEADAIATEAAAQEEAEKAQAEAAAKRGKGKRR